MQKSGNICLPDWVHALGNLKGGSRWKVLGFVLVIRDSWWVGGGSLCGVPLEEIRLFHRVACAVSTWNFTPGKGWCWLLVKCFKCPKDCLKILSWYIPFESSKNVSSKREKKGHLTSGVSKQRKHFVFNRCIKLYNRWQMTCSLLITRTPSPHPVSPIEQPSGTLDLEHWLTFVSQTPKLWSQ